MQLKQIVQSYRMLPETEELVRRTKLLLIAGVVGGGKNTVINELITDEAYHMIVSHTTRSPRMNHGVLERDGVDYHFVSLDEVTTLLEEHAFVEAKYVHGNVYGTSATELALAQSADKVAVTDIDIQGVIEYLAIKPDTHAIFLLPPSVDTWLKRLERRYGDLEQHQEEITRRFQTAYEEITHIQADERFVIVINDDLDTTVERIESVLAGEKEKSSEYAAAITEHLLAFLKSRI